MSSEPLVGDPTPASNETVKAVLQNYDEGTYNIASFQRDSDQWDDVKKSLLVESILNNLTIPSLFFARTPSNKYDIIDGQQRITTLKQFHSGDLRLVDNDEADYLQRNAMHYAGKTFPELKHDSPVFARVFEQYLLSIFKLPKEISDSTRREIFRRINEAGTPLSAQDIRLAYYGMCKSVTLIRLAGIYDPDREGSKRMVKSAQEEFKVDNPWKKMAPAIAEEWKDWWIDTGTAIGQTASEMFLWYIISCYSTQLANILSNDGYLAASLNTNFAGRTDEAADLFCDQLLLDSKTSVKSSLPAANDIENKLFPEFVKWWYKIHSYSQNVGVDRNRRMAIVFGALTKFAPTTLTNDQQDLIQAFLRNPRNAVERMKWDTIPEARGRWVGPKGQKAQIDAYFATVKKILAVK